MPFWVSQNMATKATKQERLKRFGHELLKVLTRFGISAETDANSRFIILLY